MEPELIQISSINIWFGWRVTQQIPSIWCTGHATGCFIYIVPKSTRISYWFHYASMFSLWFSGTNYADIWWSKSCFDCWSLILAKLQMSKMAQNDQKGTKMGQKWNKKTQHGNVLWFWAIFDNFGSSWTIFDNFGPFWIIWSWFWKFSTIFPQLLWNWY